MIYCPKCGIKNDEDSLFCKRCGFPLDENPENYNEPSTKKHKEKRLKTKTKTKNKTKIKYKNNNEKQKGKMSFFQSFMMLFFILLSICALGAAAFLGYYIYQNQNIVVPNVIGYTYEDAERTLKEAKLQVQMIEKITQDETEVGLVIKQNKKAGSKVMENTVIKLTVGVLDTKITVPDVEDLPLDDALKLLNKNNIKYEIKYETSDEENIVLKQSIKAGKKIENTEIVIITVSKKDETENIPQTDIEENPENTTNDNQTSDISN